MPLTSSRMILPLVLILMALMAEMSTDIYIPCMPEMACYFAVDQHTIVGTISSYLLGFSVAGSLAGPFSDRFGRRFLFLTGSFVFALSSIACMLANSAKWFIVIRFIQGTGAGISYVTTNTIIKDIYNDKVSSKIFSFMGMMVTMSPMVAPIFGGIIMSYWGWRANFSIILIGALAGFAVQFFKIQESLKPDHRQKTLSYHQILDSYKILLRTPRVIGFSLISGITCGGLWAWIATAPFYFINVIGVEPKYYGYYSAVGPAAYIVGTIVNQVGVGIMGTIRMLQYGLFTMALGSFLLFFVICWQELTFLGIYSSFSIYSIGMALVFANSAVHAVDVVPQFRGTASSILSMVGMSFAALSCYLISLVSNNNLRPATFIMFICSLSCIYLFYRVSFAAK